MVAALDSRAGAAIRDDRGTKTARHYAQFGIGRRVSRGGWVAGLLGQGERARHASARAKSCRHVL